jgi:nitrate reductase gamma subunit
MYLEGFWGCRRQKVFWGALLVLLVSRTAAAWWIDTSRFYDSAHGEFACIDCHSDIEAEPHPDPARVSRSLASLFDPEDCLQCHDVIADDLAEGFHGGQAVSDAEAYAACLDCHDPHAPRIDAEPTHAAGSVLPPDTDRSCLECHQAVDPQSDRAVQQTAAFCFYCHGQGKAGATHSARYGAALIDTANYAAAPHAQIVCLQCHPNAAAYEHGHQGLASCRQCHTRHDEKAAHDAHLRVACEACHLPGVIPLKAAEAQAVLWKRLSPASGPSNVHQMAPLEEESCRRCHYAGNTVGAAAMVLPAKSIMCMPCHSATFSVSDTTTLVALVIFVMGLLAAATFWFSGTYPGAPSSAASKAGHLLADALRTFFSAKLPVILRTLFWDVLLQRRLYRRSARRWLIHALIFYPFGLRFVWGLVALIGSLWASHWAPAWVVVDKNHPLTGLFFDLTGIMILLGVCLALGRGLAADRRRPYGMPPQDRIALGLIGAIVVIGFALEGIRIALTGAPEGSGWAFVGYGISRLVAAMTSLDSIYGYVWYGHAILTGAFIAYLPFSRLLHIIMAPLVLVMNAVESQHSQ